MLTVAVTVCVVPTGFVAEGGSSMTSVGTMTCAPPSAATLFGADALRASTLRYAGKAVYSSCQQQMSSESLMPTALPSSVAVMFWY